MSTDIPWSNPTEFAGSRIQLPALTDDVFTNGGLEVLPSKVFHQAGVNNSSQLLSRLALVQGAVQDAATGAIQDPAGSAIGTGVRPAGGGASGAIYAKFNDLEPIPQIAQGSAIFNASEGPARRVLHTYSPRLTNLSPSQDGHTALQELARAYANTVEAFQARAAYLGTDGKLLNLVPISAALYAGKFKVLEYNHLHPSYTICALAVALSSLGRSQLPSQRIYFYNNRVYLVASAILKAASG
jgi:hypothetical protein